MKKEVRTKILAYGMVLIMVLVCVVVAASAMV